MFTKDELGLEDVSTEALIEALLSADVLVTKLTLPPDIDILKANIAYRAAVENRLFKILARTMRARALRAIKQSHAIAARGGTPGQVVSAHRKAFSGWAKEVAPAVRAATKDAYLEGMAIVYGRLSGRIKPRPEAESPRREPVKKAGQVFDVLPNLEAPDLDALEALNKRHTFWIGNNHDQNMSERIRLISRKVMVEDGLGRREAADALRDQLEKEYGFQPHTPSGIKVPPGFHGTQMQYLDGLASNIVTTGRSFGSMAAFRRAGVTTYEVVNPADERTCFRHGTPVLLADGTWKAIQDIKPGQEVITREGRAKRVVGCFVKKASEWADIELDGKAVVTATTDHLIAEVGGGWVEAGDSLGSRVEQIRCEKNYSVPELWIGFQQAPKPSPTKQRSILWYEMLLGAKAGAERRNRSLQSMRERFSCHSLLPESDLLLRQLHESRPGKGEGRESLRRVRSRVQGQQKHSAPLQCLLSRMPQKKSEAGHDGSGIAQDLPSVRESISCKTNRSKNRAPEVLLGEMLPTANVQELRPMREAVSGNTVRSVQPQTLLVSMLSPRQGAVRARVVGFRPLDIGWSQPRARVQNWPMVGGFLDPTCPSCGGRRDVLALEAWGEGAGPAQNELPGIKGLYCNTPARIRGSERDDCNSEVSKFTSVVTSVQNRTTEPHAAYDIEVEDDHSYVVYPGLVVHNCKVCSYMDGRTFSVKEASETMENELGAKKPEDVKGIHPWHSSVSSIKSTHKVSPAAAKDHAATNAKLGKGGFSYPPFHFRCRCSMDISEVAASVAPAELSAAPTKIPVVPKLPHPKTPIDRSIKIRGKTVTPKSRASEYLAKVREVHGGEATMSEAQIASEKARLDALGKQLLAKFRKASKSPDELWKLRDELWGTSKIRSSPFTEEIKGVRAGYAALKKASGNVAPALTSEKQTMHSLLFRSSSSATRFHGQVEQGVVTARDFMAKIVKNPKWSRLKITVEAGKISRAGATPVYGRAGSAIGRNAKSSMIRLRSARNVATAVHEMGHTVEHADGRVRGLCNAFLKKRAGKEKVIKLNKLYPNSGYEDWEIAYKDRFADAYAGKAYDNASTEILSMGAQWLYEDPVRFATQDPEMFDFIIALVRGELFL